MNKNILISFVIILISIVSCSEASAEIKWEKDLAAAMKKAKEKNVPIMIDVYTDWCTWCKELDKNTYSHKDVMDVAKKMVSIKLNPETSEEGAEIAQRYGVQGFPTILFISADGFILENVGGYVEGEKFVPYIIESTVGCDRLVLALLDNSYCEEVLPNGDTREVMKFHPAIAPYKVAALPLNKKYHGEKAREVYGMLAKHFSTSYDETASIGKRYRRCDAIGTPFVVTVDDDTLNNGTVTLRDRDTMEQVVLKLEEVVPYVEERIQF